MRTSKAECELCMWLERSIADEAEAREGYYQLIARYADLLTTEEMYEFEEIIAEELKHSIILDKMIRRRNGIRAEN